MPASRTFPFLLQKRSVGRAHPTATPRNINSACLTPFPPREYKDSMIYLQGIVICNLGKSDTITRANITLAHCGDVKDYEGDGALLYFESVTEATQAALAIRDALAHTQTAHSDPLQARLSLNVGSVVIGVIGTTLRRSVALIGPSINLAARLLKQVPPGGIIATETVVERLRQEAPDLAQQFQLWNARLELKGFHNELVTAFHVP